MSTNKAKKKARARKGRLTPKDLAPRKHQTQGITGGSVFEPNDPKFKTGGA